MNINKFPKGYICHTQREHIRENSSSGGVFYELAKYEIEEENAVVYAAGFSKDFMVEHMRIKEVEKLDLVMRSKYVQSDINNTFNNIKEDLKSNIKVMFVGTPCQVAGLYNFLDMFNLISENILLVDFICHGVPSPKLWREYLDKLRGKYKGNIESINFREKKYGWRDYSIYIKFDNKKIYRKSHFLDEYMYYYLNDYAIRESCFDCKYSRISTRKSDITLADAWLERQEDKGESLLIVNTERGHNALEFNRKKLNIKEEDYKKYDNEVQTLNKNKMDNEFYACYNEFGFSKELRKRYYAGRQLVKNRLKHNLYITKIYKLLQK